MSEISVKNAPDAAFRDQNLRAWPPKVVGVRLEKAGGFQSRAQVSVDGNSGVGGMEKKTDVAAEELFHLLPGELPRRAGFSLSVGKHVVKRFPNKNGEPDLCCKAAYLRDNGCILKGVIKGHPKIMELRWHKQRKVFSRTGGYGRMDVSERVDPYECQKCGI